MEGIDSTKTGEYKTVVKEELVYQINWDKVKTFEDLMLLLKHNVIMTRMVNDSNLKGKDKEIKKFMKTDGTKIHVYDPETK